ncbi:MAG: transcriptional regulator NrdR [Planctomycetota bacterium]
MRCPACGKRKDKVINTREVDEGNTIKRRRICFSCGFRFTTYERYEKENLWVIKKDGSREHFQRDKILAGILKACEKRSIPMAVISDVVSAIERTIQNEYEEEVPSRRIGELVMNHLKKIDKVAYVRFASVYREFKDVKEFMDEIKPILKHSSSTKKKVR